MRSMLSLFFIAIFICYCLTQVIQTYETAIALESPRKLNKITDKWSGDFDDMISRRMIRILIPFSRTLYYFDKGHERGLSIGLARDFESYINKKYRKRLGNRPITVYAIPTSRKHLIDHVMDGEGDISAGNLTITNKRIKLIDFVGLKKQIGNTEVVVSRVGGAVIKTIEELSGKTVNVRKSSSYYQSLLKLNKHFMKEGRPLVKIELVPDELEDEDMMEMVNVGLLKIIVVDDIIVKIWKQILPNIHVDYNVFLRKNGKTGWIIRKNSPKLKAELTDFFNKFVEKNSVFDVRLMKAKERVNQLKDNSIKSDAQRFQSMFAYFKKYGRKYHFDPLMLSAQGYQESKLNQSARSPVGAIGVMQVMPATALQLNVGDITKTEENIHAGTKYMYILLKKYFGGAHFNDDNRILFALASYNAGPGNISKMRNLASACECGLDKNKWFNNVEIIVGDKIGLETTTYVRNIFKYYVSYRLIMDRKNRKLTKDKKIKK